MFFVLFGLLLLIGSVIMIYDARIISQKFFSFGDLNQASLGLKLLGFIFAIIGGIMIYCNN